MSDTLEGEWDLVIVGGGPCGLACAIEAQRAGLRCKVLEKGSIAESIRRYPRNMRFFSTSDNIGIGGIPFPTVGPKASRSEALEYYREVAEYFGLDIKLYTAVTEIEKDGNTFVVKTNKGDRYDTRNVALATGYFDFPRKMLIPGADLPHVSSYYDEPYPYAFTHVTIVGAGNSAIEAALDLYRHSAQVTIVHRGETLKKSVKYWLMPDIQNRIKEGKIKVVFNSEVKEIRSDLLIAEDQVSGELHSIPTDFVLSMIGYLPDTILFRQTGVEYNETDLIPEFDPDTFESNVPGLYLAGTVTAGTRTETVFIENGRLHGKAIVADILAKA